jgi:hypothetical protein
MMDFVGSGLVRVLLADCTADMSDALHESALARIDHF